MPTPVLETSRQASKPNQRDIDRRQQEIVEENLQEARTPKAHEKDPELSLSNRLGIPEGRDLNLSKVLEGANLSKEQRQAVAKIWTVARLDPRTDRGQDVQQLLKAFEYDPSLKNNPELLERLAEVASADTLFGKTKEELGQEEFDKLRREFLVDIIRAAVNSDTIVQGRESLCTATAACKTISHGEYLRLATDVALHGRATTASGAELTLHDGFFNRAQLMTERPMRDLRSRLPSAGTLMMLYGVMQLGDAQTSPTQPLIERQDGSYWHQYTQMIEKLTGEKKACAGRDAVIHVDGNGNAVREGATGAQETTLYKYVEQQLKNGEQVWIDTKFSFASEDLAYTAGTHQHSRHALVAEGIETHDGVTWIRCANPIGDFVNTSKSFSGHAEMFAEGTRLGDLNGFWFETAGNGDILVRQDVFDKNIRSAMVSYDEKYHFKQGDKAEALGSLDYNDGLIHFLEVDHAAEEVKEQQEHSKAEDVEDALVQFDAKTLDEKVEDKALEPGGDHAWHRRRREAATFNDEDELSAIVNVAPEEKDKEDDRDRPFSIWDSSRLDQPSVVATALAHGEGIEKPTEFRSSVASGPTAEPEATQVTESSTESNLDIARTSEVTTAVETATPSPSRVGLASSALFGSKA